MAIGSDLAEQMNLVELSRQIAALEDSGYDTTRLQVAFHSKLAQSAAPLVMVLLGLPFAFQVGRRGSLYGLGVALLLVLFYWATNAVFNALGVETVLPPIAAAWVPNLLYGFAGSYLMLFVRS
jgi:lipopolysaccharide export LptBFGC system permease protein LptF